jgi:sugar phosphate isomerase/epimerase
MAVHKRVSFNNLCFTDTPLATDIERWRVLGAHRVASTVLKLAQGDWDQNVKLLKDSGFVVATMTHLFMWQHKLDSDEGIELARKDLMKALAAAKEFKAETLYMLTGGRGPLTWEQAAERFCMAVAPCAEEARKIGVKLLIEPANPLYADVHIAHSLRDATELAEMAGIGVCIDLFPSWTEAHLQETIKRAMPRAHLVQVGDWVPGDRALSCRALLGDGMVPTDRLVGWILDAGFKGAFDLELLGPRIDKAGQVEAVRHAAEYMTNLLNRLGA